MGKILKSVHFWAWLIYIAAAIFTYVYQQNCLKQDDLLKMLDSFSAWFIFIMFSGIWMGIYFFLAELFDYN